MIKAEILAIGDELCYGRVYDTNSFWLADQVTRLGVIVQRITCIRDNPEEVCTVLRSALTRKPHFIFTTGGLGPTEDDITIEALAKLLERKVVVNEKILRFMAEKRKISPFKLMPHHFRMSSTVEGAECLPSPTGWSPLTILRVGETTIFAMPGPPNEVQGCFTVYIGKEIMSVTHNCSLAKRLKVTMYESELSPLINQILKTIPGVYLKPLVSEYTAEHGMTVEVLTFGDNEETCQSKYGGILKMLNLLVEQKGKKIVEC